MPFTSLSSVVQANSAVISSSLEKLSCSACGVDEVDIYPAVLSALTAKGAPHSVAENVRTFMQVARLSHALKLKDVADSQGRPSSSSPLEQKKVASIQEDSYMENFNVGIAMSLHTVLLSRNRIGSLLGIVQFKHCVRLSLLGNRIRTIEDCEPLALLPDLQYLSLEFNPVTQLCHYRAHLLRICAWPHELSPRTCRLRKLDSTVVTSAEVKHAVRCLQREQFLLPELLYRMQFLAFLADMEKRIGVHRELRQRGFVFQQAAETPSIEATLERGAAYALDRVPVTGAAHLVRVLVRDRHRLVAAQTVPHRPFSKDNVEKPQKTTPEGKARSTFERAGLDVDAAAKDTPSTANFYESNPLDTSNIASVSSVASCSFLTDQSEGDVQMMQSLSSLLAVKELDWSRTALRRADATEAKGTCKEWSQEAFRQTLAFLDVRICAVMLQVCRGLDRSLNTHDVDRLCRVWLHAVSHCVSTERVAYNVTGPRRLVVPRNAAVGKLRPRVQGRGTEQKLHKPQDHAPDRQSSADKGSQHDREGAEDAPPPQSYFTGRRCVEEVAQANKNVWEVGEQDGCLSNSLSSLPVVASGMSDDCAEVSMTSLSSSGSRIQPRKTIPLPIAVDCHAKPRAPSSDKQQTLASPGHFQPKPSPTIFSGETNTADAAWLLADQVFRLHAKQHAFRQWCTSLRHRWQSHIAIAYIHDRVSEVSMHTLAQHWRSPSWSGLLKNVTYIERKRGYFNWWRCRAAEKRKAHASGLERVSDLWRAQRCELSSVSLSRMQREEKHAAKVRRSSMKTIFFKWKEKAEQAALSRCATARRRVLTESPHTPETFLSLHPQSLLSHSPRNEKFLASSPVVSRQEPSDLRTENKKQQRTAEISCAPPSSLSSFGGFRLCNLAQEVPVRVEKWSSPSTLGDEEGDGISPVAPSSSDGISVNSVTSPFVADPHFAQAHVGEEVSNVSGSPHDGQQRRLLSAQALRELSPPPAIRILFPTEAAGVSPMSSPSVPRSRSLGRTGSVGAALPAPCSSPLYPSNCSAARFYGCTQPSRLPPTAAARRAIIMPSDVSRVLFTPRRERVVEYQTHVHEAASPYPAEDVEALVARAKQLEVDRAFLLSEVRKLWKAQHRKEEGAATDTPERIHTPCVHTDAEARSPASYNIANCCTVQQREIKRLESIVQALRDERHNLLKSIKTEIFQY